MATADDGNEKAPYGSGGAAKKFHKRPIETENPGGMSSDQSGKAVRISELEEMSKQVTVPMSSLSVSRLVHSYLHPTTMESLPDELLLNIFIRLLAKQLAQMRSVSKCWNALLSHPSFVKSHLHRSIRNNNNQQILLVFPENFERFTQYSCKPPHLEPTNFIKHTPFDFDPPLKVLGSVNGLICLSELSYSNIRIWNPSLSAVSAIPPPQSLPTGPNCETSIRFGFDPKTDGYKLVKISGLRNIPGILSSVIEWQPVEVYSMRKGSWEFITQPFPSHITGIFSFDYLCVDGRLYWQEFRGEQNVVAFDLGSETLWEIPLPDSVQEDDNRLHDVGVLGGKLCVVSWFDHRAWEVWVMEEYGVNESWVKRHVLSQFIGDAYFYGFTLRGELLLTDKEGRLVLHDLIANKTNMSCEKPSADKIVEYVDSLVWI